MGALKAPLTANPVASTNWFDILAPGMLLGSFLWLCVKCRKAVLYLDKSRSQDPGHQSVPRNQSSLEAIGPDKSSTRVPQSPPASAPQNSKWSFWAFLGNSNVTSAGAAEPLTRKLSQATKIGPVNKSFDTNGRRVSGCASSQEG